LFKKQTKCWQSFHFTNSKKHLCYALLNMSTKRRAMAQRWPVASNWVRVVWAKVLTNESWCSRTRRQKERGYLFLLSHVQRQLEQSGSFKTQNVIRAKVHVILFWYVQTSSNCFIRSIYSITSLKAVGIVQIAHEHRTEHNFAESITRFKSSCQSHQWLSERALWPGSCEQHALLKIHKTTNAQNVRTRMTSLCKSKVQTLWQVKLFLCKCSF